MSKLFAPVAAIALGAGSTVAPAAAAAAIVGPHAAECVGNGGKPAMLVRVLGLKARTGMVRVQSYGGDPAHYFDKGSYIERVDVATPATGPVEVCMPVPRSGSYAISIRHDLNGSGKSDMSDGGGFSGNPSVSLMDIIFKRRPSPVQVEVKVASGVTRVPIVLNYVQGGSVKPIASAER
ncbi:DUF2141 domain-containing protein [Sphingomonas sp. BIUV-7]|uniref:DUF2141 domain-containing protein n=1 Tax=Sphingomonas natans TaxID=3063330 RepID=A0ABT8Y9V6_9SPHN|nr:DUF2141 domain-containing protein [Sphingomonas sp. BIUV-7]MDO6415114.1 DUF2141 domain-containing protein [Sphingomonas sp. BIUV-7]